VAVQRRGGEWLWLWLGLGHPFLGKGGTRRSVSPAFNDQPPTTAFLDHRRVTRAHPTGACASNLKDPVARLCMLSGGSP